LARKGNNVSNEDVSIILEAMVRYRFEAVVAAVVVFLLVKFCLRGYLSEKGKNLATKEDIVEITNKIEEVKSQYQEITENLKATHQLRLAAIDKRLKAHQEAYGLWRKINGNIGTKNIYDVILECDSWWSKNSLYLEPAPREAFLAAWVSAKDLEWYAENSNQEIAMECRKKIEAAGVVITNAVELPTLNELINTKKPDKSL